MMNRAKGKSAAVACVLIAFGCTQPLKLTKDDSPVVLSHQLITAPNPGDPGSYRVLTMYYGNGTDKHRREYKDSVRLKTPTVDASAFVEMSPDVAKDRESYWGFGVKKYPLNGRVWYPEG